MTWKVPIHINNYNYNPTSCAIPSYNSNILHYMYLPTVCYNTASTWTTSTI